MSCSDYIERGESLLFRMAHSEKSSWLKAVRNGRAGRNGGVEMSHILRIAALVLGMVPVVALAADTRTPTQDGLV